MTFPVVAPPGTIATIVVEFQLVMLVAVVPPNVMVLNPWDDPKFTPVIVTEDPIAPPVAERLLIPGAELDPTTKRTPLLAKPPTVTMTNPVVAPEGTGTLMKPVLQLVGAAVTPLKVTVLVPCVEPKLDPEIVTEVVTGPDVGERPVMFGPPTVKFKLLLATPLTITMSGPEVAPAGTGTTMAVALQLVGVAVVALNVTLLAPCVDPKFWP